MKCIECDWYSDYDGEKTCNLVEEYLDEAKVDCKKIDEEGNIDYSK